MNFIYVIYVTFAAILLTSVTCGPDAPVNKSAKSALVDEDPAKDLDKQTEKWNDIRAAWERSSEPEYENDLDFSAPRDTRANWQGLQSAWGKRADWQGLQSAWGKRGANWQGLQSAWGKRGDWRGLQSAWGKRGINGWDKRNPAWDEQYMQIIKQMDAMKNRRSNWQSLASWGKRR